MQMKNLKYVWIRKLKVLIKKRMKKKIKDKYALINIKIIYQIMLILFIKCMIHL